MKMRLFTLSLALALYSANPLNAHCQMPCGIYHDNMVFDQIDQYVETMFKAMSVLTENKFTTVKERNEFTRWVIEKERESNDAAELFLKYFLQQKIKPGEEDTVEKLKSVHKLLFLIVAIKQNADTKIVMDFGAEWGRFKELYHPEGYDCQVELLKCNKNEKEFKSRFEMGNHDHDHDHDHVHGPDTHTHDTPEPAKH